MANSKLSKSTLDNLDAFTEPLVIRQEQLNVYVIRKISRRIKEIGEILPSDVYQLEQLLKSGADVREINAEIARITALQEKEIKKIIKDVAEGIYLDAKPYYDYRHRSFIPYDKNENLQKIIRSIGEQTAMDYTNIARTQAFMLRDPTDRNTLIPTNAAQAYYSVIDEAIQAVKLSGFDYNTAIRRTLNQLINSGLRRVSYEAESGRRHTQRLDAAVRRNILDGIRQMNQAVQDQTGKEFGANGVELSAHENPAPDHQDIQGRVFTNEEYEKMQTEQDFYDVKGRHYPAMHRHIGFWNCRHFAYSVVVESNIPAYTDEQLRAILARNQKGYTDSKGRHYTGYQCTEMQRKYELDIRRAKEAYLAWNDAGNDKEATRYKAKVKNLMHEYKVFSANCGLSVKYEKTRVQGY